MTAKNSAARRTVLSAIAAGPSGSRIWIHSLSCGHIAESARKARTQTIACERCVGPERSPESFTPDQEWGESVEIRTKLALAQSLGISTESINLTLDPHGRIMYAIVMLDSAAVSRLM